MSGVPGRRALRAGTLVALAMAATLVTGCWSRRELDTLGFVMAIGVDRAVEDRKIQLTVHIAKPFAMVARSEAGGTLENKPFWVVSSTGYTVFEAMRNLVSQSPRRPYWSHSRFVLIGEDFAREGIGDILDQFQRDPRMRHRAWIVIAKGARASDLLQVEFELEPMPSEGGMGILLATRAELSTAVADYTLHTFLLDLEGEGVDPVATRAEIVRRPHEFDIRGDLTREVIGASARITGAAVFRDDKLVGWLNKPETRGLNWVTGRVKSTVIVIKKPGDEDNLIGLNVVRARGSFAPHVEGEEISVLVKIEAEAAVEDVQGFVDPLKSPGFWDSMERRMATVIRNEVLAAVEKAKELDADIFGFGAELNRRAPKKWEAIKDRWDQEFRRVRVEVDVRARVTRPGLAIRSVRIME